MLTLPILAQLIAPAGLFSLIVKGSVIGLAASVLILLLIWGYEWRRGKIW